VIFPKYGSSNYQKAGQVSATRIQEFAKKHRLRVEVDPCGEEIIPSRVGRFADCHIYQHDIEGHVFGLILAGFRSQQLPQGYISQHKPLLQSLGCAITQEGDREAVFLFDPENDGQTRAVIEIGKISQRRIGRQLTPEQRQAAGARLTAARAARRCVSSAPVDLHPTVKVLEVPA
jgi:hypothetical protein